MANHDFVHLLIVDDDRSVQRVLADALTRQGFTVTVERDGAWAVKTFEKKSFDAVLLDLMLPGLDGYQVARQIQSSPRGRKTPILMMSAVNTSNVHQAEAVSKYGAFAFLEKPVKVAELLKVLRAVLKDRYPRAPDAPVVPTAQVDDDDPITDPSLKEERELVEDHARKAGAAPSIRGDLSQKPFPELLAEVYRWRGTGALLLRRDKVKKIVYFREGQPQSIKSNLASECLGRVMVREKMISQAECDESVLRMKSSRRQQGTVLIEMGSISPHNLVYGLSLQLQAKLFDIFTWNKGEYQFNPTTDPVPELANLELTTAAAIYEGIRRFDQSRLARAMGEVDALFVHPTSDPLYALQDAGLGDEEQQLLLAADGHKTVATLRALALLPPLDTMRLVYAMKCAQMVELRSQPADGKSVSPISRLAEPRTPPPLRPAPAAEPPPLPPGARKSPEVPAVAVPAPFEAWDAPPGPAPEPDEEATGPALALGARVGSSLLPELSSVISTRHLSGEESQLRERLVAQVNQMRKVDYFAVLGISTTANREAIKRAYFSLAKEFHPDKHFGSASAEIRQLAGQIYDLISTAHDTLADPEERERYLKELASGVKRDIGDEVGKILAAENRFQRGEELLRQRQLGAAHQQFGEAISLYADEGEFHAYFGWTLFQLNPADPVTADSAMRSLERAISLNPKIDKGYLFSGYVYKATGRPDKAERQFEKAIQCNPDCTEALRELRILGKGKR